MEIRNHIAKLSWSMLDKALFLIYGFVFLLIINFASVSDYGIYAIILAIHNWIFTISDSLTLQSIIQFGMVPEFRLKVNTISIIFHSFFTLLSSFLIIFLSSILTFFLNEPTLVEAINYLPLISLSFILRTFSQKIMYRDQTMFNLFISNLSFFCSISLFYLYVISVSNSLSLHALISGYIFGGLVSSLISVILIKKRLLFGLQGLIKVKNILKFNIQMTIVSLLFSAPRQLDIVLLKVFFSLEYIGLYSAAKTIFRVFEEVMNAISALVYPSAVKHTNQNNQLELLSILKKSVTYGFVIFSTLFLIFYLFGSFMIFQYLIPQKFYDSYNYFKILLFSLPFLPLTFLYSVMVAQNKMKEIIILISIGIAIFIFTLFLIGYNHLVQLIPLPFVSYYLLIGLISIIYAKKVMKIDILSIDMFYKNFVNYFKKN